MEMAAARPTTLDEFAALPGVGAAKLERYGKPFLEVITGATEEVHPARRRVAGRDEGKLMDALQAAQVDLARGPMGTDTYMSCNVSTLAKIAARRPQTQADLASIPGVGDQKADRFGPAFLRAIEAAAGV
ncbi:MAG: HRDC domain-containing protein [Pseudomonadota bacterium]